MENKDLFLIFINPMGINWEGFVKYQMIFSKNPNDVDEGNDWDIHPASSGLIGIPPNDSDKDAVLEITFDNEEIKFNLIQKSNSFSFYDAMEGIVSLAWEDLTNLEHYPENRLFFHYGEKINKVKEKLFNREIKYELIFERNGTRKNNN